LNTRPPGAEGLSSTGPSSAIKTQPSGFAAEQHRSAFAEWKAGLLPNARASWYGRALRSTASARLLLATGGLAIQAYFVLVLSAAALDLLWAVLAYWVFAASAYLVCLVYPERRGVQAAVAIVVDIVSAMTFYGLASSRPGSGNALIHAWPVIEAAILGSGYLAGLVAIVLTAFVLIINSWLEGSFSFSDIGVVYTVFSGIGLIALGTLTHQLVTRLAQQEGLSEAATRANARLQAVTRLAVAGLEDGMLVMTRAGRLDLANPVALRWLGLAGAEMPQTLLNESGEPLRASLAPLFDAIETLQLLEPGQVMRATFDVGGDPVDVSASVRVVKAEDVGASPSDEDALVVVLRDAKSIESRVHEAKLAAMGRLVAAIAHEVRNPLSAVTQAAELLREKATGTEARLAQMILTNSARINVTVEDVLALGRRERVAVPRLDLLAWLREWLAEQAVLNRGEAGSSGTPDRPVIDVRLAEGAGVDWVLFTPDHLRRVMSNLLENALRYCSREPGAVQCVLTWDTQSQGAGQAEIVLNNDGPVIESAQRAVLFEPFNSSEARGTGLGLFISRELCVKNGATLDYRVAYSGRGEFVITIPLAQPQKPMS
jgi:two-component system, NtrC family, sensor histidine kinase PilS